MLIAGKTTLHSVSAKPTATPPGIPVDFDDATARRLVAAGIAKPYEPIFTRANLVKTKTYGAARIRSASYNEEANTIDVVWSTGADVTREDYDGPYVERLLMGAGNVRLARLNSGAPLLDTHSSGQLSNVIGSVVSGSAKIENGRGVATVKLSSARSDADTIAKIREGVIKNISVGYLIHASTRIDTDPPVIEISDWEPLEVSAVPIPADPGAQIRSANGSNRQPLSRRERRFRNGAAEATRLLTQSTQTRAESRGASGARKLLAGKASSEPVKPAVLDETAVRKGARAARKLFRK